MGAPRIHPFFPEPGPAQALPQKSQVSQKNLCSAVRIMISQPTSSILLPGHSLSSSSGLTSLKRDTTADNPDDEWRDEDWSTEYAETEAGGRGIDAGGKGERHKE